MFDKAEFVKNYHSTLYKHTMPESKEGWNRVVERLNLNFGEFFSLLPSDAAILDVACGVGYMEHCLLKRGFTNVEAIDLSGEQVEVAKSKLLEHGLKPDAIKFQLIDAFAHLKAHKDYQMITMIDFLEHFPKSELMELLRLAYDSLRKDGLLIVRTINADNPLWARSFYHDFTHETPFTPDSIRQCLSIAGFDAQKIEYEQLPPFNDGLFKSFLRASRSKILELLFRIPSISFAEDMVVVAKK